MLKKILVGLAIVIVALVTAAVWLDVPRFVIGLIQYGHQAREGTLRVGDPAPAVSVYDVDGVTPRAIGEWVGAKPLVLIFGSFT